jgi:2-methylisocitrate lyase-like PEP mutase family enzyme
MNDQDRGFDAQVPPWDDQELLEEQDAIDRMDAAVAEARDAGATEAARLTVIAVANYVWQSQDWPAFVERANTLLGELEDKLSRRWG